MRPGVLHRWTCTEGTECLLRWQVQAAAGFFVRDRDKLIWKGATSHSAPGHQHMRLVSRDPGRESHAGDPGKSGTILPHCEGSS